jgi:hypothetical protein
LSTRHILTLARTNKVEKDRTAFQCGWNYDISDSEDDPDEPGVTSAAQAAKESVLELG